MSELSPDRERWERRHGQHEQIREVFREPYLKSVAPVLAGTIEIQAQPSIKVLVVGGGKGRFSKVLLPQVRELLKSEGHKTQIDVVESDLGSVVRQAPGKRLRADAGALPFRDRSFDLVVGESMIHQEGPEKVHPWMKEISRVLRPHGAFVHVQDFTPDPRRWTPVAEVMGLSEEHPTVRTGPETHHLLGLVEELAHLNLLDSIAKAAEREGLGFLHVDVGQAVVVPKVRRKLTGAIPLDFAEANRWDLRMGSLSGGHSGSVPGGKTRLTYTGKVTIATKDPRHATRILELLRERRARESPGRA